MKVTLLIIASLLLASSALTISPPAVPPKCPAISNNMLSNATACLRKKLIHQGAWRCSGNTKKFAQAAKNFANNRIGDALPWASSGSAAFIINFVNGRVAREFGNCVYGKKSTYYSKVISLVHALANNAALKKEKKGQWKNLKFFDVCTSNLVNISSQSPAVISG